MKKLRLAENTIKNHEEFFPNHESKLQKTDPEFNELFDNWALDEVIRQSKSDTKSRVMLLPASTIASQALREYKVMVTAALNVGVTPGRNQRDPLSIRSLRRNREGLRLSARLQRGTPSKGISLPLEGQSTTTPETRYEKGLVLQKAIFREAIDKMRQQSPKDQMHILDFLAANCFSDCYTRNGYNATTHMVHHWGQQRLRRHITDQLLNRGDRVIGTDRDTRKVTDLIKRYPQAFNVEVLDMTDIAAIRDLVGRSFARHGRIDVIIGSAGYGLFGAAKELTDEQVEHIVATNLIGPIHLIRAALPHLRAQGGGRVIHISSYGGQVAFAGNSIHTLLCSSGAGAGMVCARRLSDHSDRAGDRGESPASHGPDAAA